MNRKSPAVGSALRVLAALAMLAVGSGCPPEATPPTTNGDSDTGDGDAGDGDGDGDCLGPDGCFDCEPSNSVELTNACTDATCEAFDNSQARLPLIGPDGTLPPLP